MEPDELIMSGSRAVTPPVAGAAMVVVRAGRIAEVRAGRAGKSDGVIDVGDSVLMPGVIDTHVHVNEPGRTEWEGFATATRAAAAGGVTSMVVMPLNCRPAATSAETLRGEAAAAEGKCLVDYGFWGGGGAGNEGTLEAQWQAGALGFKCFTAPSGVDDFGHVGEAELRRAMPVLSRLGAVLL